MRFLVLCENLVRKKVVYPLLSKVIITDIFKQNVVFNFYVRNPYIKTQLSVNIIRMDTNKKIKGEVI